MSNEPVIDMTEDEFFAAYKPRVNHLDDDAPYDGCLYETYGEAIEFVRSQDPRTIWTLCDGDEGGEYIFSGYHLVNRFGYFITTEPFPEGVLIQVCTREPEDDDFEEDDNENNETEST